MRNDLISRCKLFNRLATLPAPAEANTFKAEVYKIIQEMETEDRPQGEWIPCSERLPQYRDVVLISTFWGVRVAERDGIKEDGTDDFWYLFLNDATAHPRYVYAWIPLPKPWKGADDER